MESPNANEMVPRPQNTSRKPGSKTTLVPLISDDANLIGYRITPAARPYLCIPPL